MLFQAHQSGVARIWLQFYRGAFGAAVASTGTESRDSTREAVKRFVAVLAGRRATPAEVRMLMDGGGYSENIAAPLPISDGGRHSGDGTG